MIDIENQVFTRIASVLRETYSGIYVTGEYVRQPPKFPAVYIMEMDNTVYYSGRDNVTIENFADVMYQVDVYSNKNTGRKTEVKSILQTIDSEFAAMGFTRQFLNPVPNFDDATIYRMTARYVATVGKDEKIYRR